MIEMLINPRKSERRPWEMFFVGLFYASVAVLLVTFVFGRDTILREGSGLLVVLFTVIACLPFMYFIIKIEEDKDVEITKSGRLLKEHSKALHALMWLFLGFVIAFSFWYIMLPEHAATNFNFQIRTFCAINSPANFQQCIESHGLAPVTGGVTKTSLIMNIFANNIYVLIFTLLFSLAFGAGAMFVLVWNASVIATAVGIFAKNLSGMPMGLFRYMIHGIPETAAYFIGALAGGIVSVAVIRKDLRGDRMWRILQDALLLVIIAVLILAAAALMEVYLTPIFFS
ncbi:MAG: stage II sporulation protein M [Candidatus Nanoarchaeia archaeon]